MGVLPDTVKIPLNGYNFGTTGLAEFGDSLYVSLHQMRRFRAFVLRVGVSDLEHKRELLAEHQ